MKVFEITPEARMQEEQINKTISENNSIIMGLVVSIFAQLAVLCILL